jgi:hypothetical protein
VHLIKVETWGRSGAIVRACSGCHVLRSNAVDASCMQDDQMFMAELGVMRKLSHPYIVRYLGCGVLTEKSASGNKNYIAIVRPNLLLPDPSAHGACSDVCCELLARRGFCPLTDVWCCQTLATEKTFVQALAASALNEPAYDSQCCKLLHEGAACVLQFASCCGNACPLLQHRISSLPASIQILLLPLLRCYA